MIKKLSDWTLQAKLSPTLSHYLAVRYMINTAVLFLLLLAVIDVFDMVELIRRASKRSDIPFSLVLEMSWLKLPHMGQILMPFAVLFSAMLTFWQLTRRYELIVMRAAGFSAWQFLAPLLFVAAALGVFQMTALNPLGALLLSRYDHLEQTRLSAETTSIALFREGLWLRQQTQGGYVIIHADKISASDWAMQNIMVLQFNEKDQMVRRMDAPTGYLKPGEWVFENVRTTDKTGKIPIAGVQVTLPTTLSSQDVENSFSAPETIAFWNLPDHIRTLQETGFEASRLKVRFHHLLAQPLMLMAMILLAASVAMRPPRSRGGLFLIVSGVGIGFLVFFISSYLEALGSARELPAAIAAWSPAIICTLLGVSVLMMLEDG